MSERVYVKNHQTIVVKNVGQVSSPPADNDLWDVTVQLEPGVEGVTLRTLLWTTQLKELLAPLESSGWKKESSGEPS